MGTDNLIEWLKGQDITAISKETGIPRDRMYKWKQGKGSPKSEDYVTLLEFMQRQTGSSSNVVSKRIKELSKGTHNIPEGTLFEKLQLTLTRLLLKTDNATQKKFKPSVEELLEQLDELTEQLKEDNDNRELDEKGKDT